MDRDDANSTANCKQRNALVAPTQDVAWKWGPEQGRENRWGQWGGGKCTSYIKPFMSQLQVPGHLLRIIMFLLNVNMINVNMISYDNMINMSKNHLVCDWRVM